MPTVDSDKNVAYQWTDRNGRVMRIEIYKATGGGFWYYVANVDGETIENYSETEAGAFRAALDGLITLT